MAGVDRQSTEEQNRLLRALPREEYERLRPSLAPVDLAFKQCIYEKDQPIEHVYFVRVGVVSMVSRLEDGMIVEVATIGNEGMVGLPVYLGAESVSLETFAQIPGEALRMPTPALQEAVAQGGALARLLRRYTQALFIQIAQGSACNRSHTIDQRLARWLLATHDRVEGPEFPLTQEFMAQMLGVQRPSVNLAAQMLQHAGLIHYSRGRISVLNREVLEATACECYAAIRGEYERLLEGPAATD